MDTETVQYNFSTFFLVPEALLRYRVVVVMKLKNCRVPSAANHTFVEAFFPTVVTITTLLYQYVQYVPTYGLVYNI